MTERRPSTGGGLSAPKERPAGESVARLSDHLGRLLAHADRLLVEWQAHAESLRGRFESQGEAAGEALARVLEALGRIGAERADVRSIDINPLIVAGATPVVIDALVELEGAA